jgi:uncharacterized protein (DUF983 family)
MALTTRKRRALGIMIGGVITVAIGAIVYATTKTPLWVPLAVQGVGMIGNLLGFAWAFPDTD